MINFVIRWMKKIFSSLFFLGYIPLVPGSIASLAVVILLWYFQGDIARYFTVDYIQHFWLGYILFVAICILLTNNAKQLFNADDPKQIIIDECAGQIITFFLIPINMKTLILGFILFRFFDIVKPFPVYKFEEIEGGTGIVMDDVAAGVMANISLYIILWVYHVVNARLI